MNVKYLKIAMLGIFVLAVVLWVFGMVIESFNFPIGALFATLCLGGGALFAVAGFMYKQHVGFIFSGLLLAIGFLILGITYEWVWWVIVVAAVLSIAGLSILRLSCNIKKWDAGNK